MHRQSNRPSPPLVEPGFMPQLDGLRALAVLLVLNHHFLNPSLHFPLRPLVNRLGPLGVQLFFVISGFLITGILLRCRNEGTAVRLPLATRLQRFYVRRFLRIFPVYYLVLLTTVVCNFENMRELFPWHAVYLSNVYFTLHNSWGIGPSSHFWSLSVEEQFYLMWPLVILLLPRRALTPATILLWLSAPAYRLVGYYAGWREVALYYLPIGCLDSLSAGALLALVSDPAYGSAKLRNRLQTLALAVGLPATALCLYLLTAGFSAWRIPAALLDSSTACLFFWLVSRAAQGFRGPAASLLGAGPLAYIGRISYGIYIYHFFVFWIIFRNLPTNWPHPLLWSYLGAVAATLVVAAASFHLFERPINRLKRYFPYAGSTPPRRASGPFAIPSASPAQSAVAP